MTIDGDCSRQRPILRSHGRAHSAVASERVWPANYENARRLSLAQNRLIRRARFLLSRARRNDENYDEIRVTPGHRARDRAQSAVDYFGNYTMRRRLLRFYGDPAETNRISETEFSNVILLAR